MSLDVYLEAPEPGNNGGSGIFVRRNGQTVEISGEEWDRAFPGQEPVIATLAQDEVYWSNITHNLGQMADAAGIYKALWRPNENGLDMAAQLIEPLEDGLGRLRASPDEFKAFNPTNGWGDYDVLVRFVADYLAACKTHPGARVRVSR
jgi:hypothetical protein